MSPAAHYSLPPPARRRSAAISASETRIMSWRDCDKGNPRKVFFGCRKAYAMQRDLGQARPKKRQIRRHVGQEYPPRVRQPPNSSASLNTEVTPPGISSHQVVSAEWRWADQLPACGVLWLFIFGKTSTAGLSLTCSPSSLNPPAQGPTPFKPPTMAGIELSFGRNAKPSGISFTPIRADFRRRPLGVTGCPLAEPRECR